MNTSDKVLESSIKSLVINHLFLENHDASITNNKFIINEFSIANFSRRVDLVLAKDNQLFAFEVKSEFDSLTRLKGQVDEYLEHFDKVTVVAATKHIEKALQLTPKNVAIWEISETQLKVIRKGRTKKIADKFKFIKMMTLNELLHLAKKMNIDVKDKKRKIVELSLIKIPTNILRNEAITRIRARYKKRELNYYDESNFQHSNFKINNILSHKKIEKKSNIISDIDKFIYAIENL
ncbi:sce7726 family protein [Pectobacterium brasiliense]|uniref:sce7726 family protein n=1 Tax=Pectobacterium brasiliense TaxID=180957 RepID=UPI0040447262